MKRKADVAEFQSALLERIRTEGVEAAYEASLAICRDPKAPSPAKATASATLFRVAGYFGANELAHEKQPHEMTAEELEAAASRAMRLLERFEAGGYGYDEHGNDDGPSIFG